jgi:hypothetical protein
MDPATRAMQQLTARAEAFWRVYPGRLLPLIAAEEDRSLVVQALRLRENAPDNRRPFFVVEEPFTGSDVYFPRLAAHIAEQYERLRQGVADEGVTLVPFAAGGDLRVSGSALAQAGLAADRVARLLGEQFDGIVVALVPDHVANVAHWREGVRVLAETRWSPRVRFAVLAPPGGPLASVLPDIGARFELDPGAMLAFLAQPGPDAPEATTPGLRPLLLAATKAQAAGDFSAAAARYREARARCQSEGLLEQEIVVLLALAGACLAAGAPDLAVQSYRDAAMLAESAEAWALACHAWMGMGGAFLPDESFAPAVVAFRAAEAAAKRGEIPSLEAEAGKMVGTCLRRLGREVDNRSAAPGPAAGAEPSTP